MALSSVTRGTISELRVETDLLERGYHVFRSESSGCPCDIVAIKDGKCIKIEVRTLQRKGEDKGVIPPHHLIEHELGFVDWFAFVIGEEIFYQKSGDNQTFIPD